MTDNPKGQVLSDIKVLDLTRARSGPTAVRQLADWGADVVKIETPGADADADLGQRNAPDFQNLHRNKQAMTLDLKSDGGKEIFYRMVKDADVVVENMRPGVKHRLEVDYDTLRSLNPRVVYASISGFGQDGPYSERPCLDQIAQGMGGHMMVTGVPGEGPMRSGAAISDMTAGILCANGIALALLEREKSGEGQWVQTSLLEAMIFLLDFQAARWLIDKEVAPQQGNHHPTIAPMGAFRTQDSFINIAPMPNHWSAFCQTLGMERLIDDPKYATFDARVQHRAELIVEIEKLTIQKPSEFWIQALNKARVPCGPIYTMDEVFADPQIVHSGIASKVTSPIRGDIELVGQPLHLSRTPNRHDVKEVSAAPAYGENTIVLLKRYGYSDDDISILKNEGVI
ncbi:MAG: Acetyl-CoA:oxalate CoA-transferase [Alphaproteobacteria bacterium MarineAlpha11_Bin1]|nr:MAG: Acetyl-CoA:oxalate CoA-transferase [Alphaproteobacteria bacterium MarineAlpha11_Bin1]|tara:strand:- start:6821 stop:8017 length:1197 start_codon:yes stop_codon:yes gene_type:complete